MIEKLDCGTVPLRFLYSCTYERLLLPFLSNKIRPPITFVVVIDFVALRFICLLEELLFSFEFS